MSTEAHNRRRNVTRKESVLKYYDRCSSHQLRDVPNAKYVHFWAIFHTFPFPAPPYRSLLYPVSSLTPSVHFTAFAKQVNKKVLKLADSIIKHTKTVSSANRHCCLSIRQSRLTGGVMFVRLPVCPFVRLSVTDISATVRLIGVKFNTIVESSAPDRSPDMSSPLLVAISLRSPNGGQNWLFGQFVFGVTLSLSVINKIH